MIDRGEKRTKGRMDWLWINLTAPFTVDWRTGWSRRERLTYDGGESLL